MSIGYNVEGRRFGTKVAQARAFARHRASTFGRPVAVAVVDHAGIISLVEWVSPS
jgi:uncharacterized protein GlcG (DUF336 family)